MLIYDTPQFTLCFIEILPGFVKFTVSMSAHETSTVNIMSIITTITRKRFSEKPIVAFTNSTVFILDLHIYVCD